MLRRTSYKQNKEQAKLEEAKHNYTKQSTRTLPLERRCRDVGLELTLEFGQDATTTPTATPPR
jgi:hypothetical protein